MRLPETRDLFVRNVEFPATKDSVIAAVGEAELDDPSGGTESIAVILDRTEVAEFRSADDLYDTLLSRVGEQFIGQKYYDDRGTTVKSDDEEVHL